MKASVAEATETSPLLLQQNKAEQEKQVEEEDAEDTFVIGDERSKEDAVISSMRREDSDDDDNDDIFPVSILVEIMGARHLSSKTDDSLNLLSMRPTSSSSSASAFFQYYCVAQFGSQRLHHTKAVSAVDRNPLWSIKDSPLFIVPMTINDIRNHKPMVITVWGRHGKNQSSKTAINATSDSPSASFMGKVRIKANELLEMCNEKRIEHELLDDLGRSLEAQMAFRCRFASTADVLFTNVWNKATSNHSHRITRNVLQGAQVIPQENRPQATLLSELEGWEVSGARFTTAATSKIRLSKFSPTKRRQRKGMIRIKPGPDPDGMNDPYLTPEDLKEITQQPSRQWIQAGNCDSSKYGRLYVEILSCHGLPNVDYGTNLVGNQTDAFVSVVYGDVMAQTPIIDDELSPHWPPWTPRAFVFSILHPSHSLYLAVFGYKRGVFYHVPIGRVQINLKTLLQQQSNTQMTLQYDLYPSSHVIQRSSKGCIRLRIRREIFKPRAFLFASLRSSPPIYLNYRKKETWYVAKYTVFGEYDNLDTFEVKVLLAYIDELTQGFLRRLAYACADGTRAVIYWRAPLHSFFIFVVGILIVEQPYIIPAVLAFILPYVMLVNNALRVQSPSPWYRCRSYLQYMCIFIFGRTLTTTRETRISPHEGWEDQCQKEEQVKSRARKDNIFSEKKGKLEQEIEAMEKISLVQTTENRSAIMSVELLELLGKIQGVIGRIIQKIRSIDLILGWEDSDRAFWLTSLFLVVGVVFLLLPWAFLFKWTGRVAVVLLLGPQNKLLDIYWKKYHADEEGKLRQMFEERIFRARCKQEDITKLKAFRQVLFGKYGLALPDLSWTPHLDRPRPESTAVEVPAEDDPALQDLENNKIPYVPGQKLYGVMIPRPYNQWLANSSESRRTKELVTRAQVDLKREHPEKLLLLSSQHDADNMSCVEEEGVEVTDVIDVEADLMALSITDPVDEKKPRSSVNFRDSLKGDWGVEATDLYEDEAIFVRNSWQFISSEANMLCLSSSEDCSDDDGGYDASKGPNNAAGAKKDSKATQAHIRKQWIASQQEEESAFRVEDKVSPSMQEDSCSHELITVHECDEKKLPEGDDELPDGPFDIPTLATVRTFEADPEASNNELGFEIEDILQ